MNYIFLLVFLYLFFGFLLYIFQRRIIFNKCSKPRSPKTYNLVNTKEIFIETDFASDTIYYYDAPLGDSTYAEYAYITNTYIHVYFFILLFICLLIQLRFTHSCVYLCIQLFLCLLMCLCVMYVCVHVRIYVHLFMFWIFAMFPATQLLELSVQRNAQLCIG